MSFFSALGKALKSKTVWTGIGTIAVNGLEYLPMVAQFVPPGSGIAVGINVAIGAMTIYGRIRAKQPLGPVIDDTIKNTVDAVHMLQGSQANEHSLLTGVNARTTPDAVAEVTAVVKSMPPPAK